MSRRESAHGHGSDIVTPRSSATVGVTAGKFNPPHRGHALLLSRAAERVDRLHVLVCDHPEQTIPASTRLEWLSDGAPPNVAFHLTPDDLPEDDSVAWGARALDVLGVRPDVAFTSETYGDAWATAMGCRHEPIDPCREFVPIRGRDLRADLQRGFVDLLPAVRASLTKRVVMVGPESTGKTTLARDLAARLSTAWVPEWARTYDTGMRTSPLRGYDAADFCVIARAQATLEDWMARRSTGILLCDTDALLTAVWHRRYVGRDDPNLDDIVASRRPDLYLLTGMDVAWADDGTRESSQHRESMFADCVHRLEQSGVPWELVAGPPTERVELATEVISGLPPLPELV